MDAAALCCRSRVGLQVAAEAGAPKTPTKKAVPLVAQSLNADQILNLYGNWCVAVLSALSRLTQQQYTLGRGFDRLWP